MHVRIGFFSTVLVCFVSLHVHAQPQTKADLVFPLIVENSTKLNGSLDGYHGSKVKKILDQLGLSYDVRPPSGAYKRFYRGDYTCVTPDSRLYYGETGDFIDSLPFSEVEWVIVQREGSPPILHRKDLKGLKVGSFYPPEEIAYIVPQSGVTYDVEPNLTVNMLKVALNRLDVAVLPATGLEELIQGNDNLKNLSIRISPPLAHVKEAVMCHDNERGLAVIEKVNKALAILHD